MAIDMDKYMVEVDALLRNTLDRYPVKPLAGQYAAKLYDGTRLRARLAIRAGIAAGVPTPDLIRSAAAVELVRTASLLHDDVTDDAGSHPDSQALWVNRKTSTDILLGDLMMCVAMSLLMESGDGALIAEFVARTREMCEAEAAAELLHREPQDWAAVVEVARHRTGPLFAFAGFAAGNRSPGLCAALREAGYKTGTAYQIAEDVGAGRPAGAGTPARIRDMPKAPAEFIRDVCAASCNELSPWPAVLDAWHDFLRDDVQPAILKLLSSAAQTRNEPVFS